MEISEPQSPFLKHVPENEQNFFNKKFASILQTDKENVTSQNLQLHVDKMQIGQNEIDGYLIEVGENIRMKKEVIRDLFKGLQKQNSSKRVIIGLSGRKIMPENKGKSISSQKPIIKQNPLYNLNLLLKLRAQEYPFVAMFASNCLMNILKLYLSKKSQYKEEDLKIKWKFDFVIREQKIGQLMMLYDLKGDDVYVNMGIRLRLQNVTDDQQSFSRDLLSEVANRLNISKNLKQTATKIHQQYEDSLMFLGQEVQLKSRQPNEWEQILSGKFTRVNSIGNAILENEEGVQEEIEDGIMELKNGIQEIQIEENGQGGVLQGIGI